jgi:hypothetical protein
MIVSNTRFQIEIRAVSHKAHGYVVEVTGPRLDEEQYAVGENNSLSNLIARICNRLEIDVPPLD